MTDEEEEKEEGFVIKGKKENLKKQRMIRVPTPAKLNDTDSSWESPIKQNLGSRKESKDSNDSG